MLLHPLERVQEDKAYQRERQEAAQIGGPGLVRVGVDAAEAVEAALHPGVPGARVHAGQIVPHGDVHRGEQSDDECDLQGSRPTVRHQNFSGAMRAKTR